MLRDRSLTDITSGDGVNDDRDMVHLPNQTYKIALQGDVAKRIDASWPGGLVAFRSMLQEDLSGDRYGGCDFALFRAGGATCSRRL